MILFLGIIKSVQNVQLKHEQICVRHDFSVLSHSRYHLQLGKKKKKAGKGAIVFPFKVTMFYLHLKLLLK